jgi:Flp pilus assembly protein TadD
MIAVSASVRSFSIPVQERKMTMTKKKIANPSPEFMEVNLDDLLKSAHKSVEKGKYRDAIRSLVLVTEMVPEHTEAWNNLGVSYLLAGDLEQAERAFRSGLEQDPENPQMIKNLIQALLQIENKVSEGTDLLVKYLDLRPTDPDAMYMLGRCLEAAGETMKAKAIYERVLQLDPNYKLAAQAWKEISLTQLDN